MHATSSIMASIQLTADSIKLYISKLLQPDISMLHAMLQNPSRHPQGLYQLLTVQLQHLRELRMVTAPSTTQDRHQQSAKPQAVYVQSVVQLQHLNGEKAPQVSPCK